MPSLVSLFQRVVFKRALIGEYCSDSHGDESHRLGALGAKTEDTVGWDIWQGATTLLCQHLVRHPELVCGKR